MKTTYDPDSSMRSARAQYFIDNAFGDDGGYGDAWVDFKLGPVPFPFPNTKARLKALAYHDLHHISTGYATDIRGEFEISAWEVGAGCKDFAAAWVLNLSGMAGGVLAAPVRTFRAFVRGCRSETFYGRDVNGVLAMRVADARASAKLDRASTDDPSLRECALFALASVAGIVVGTALMSVLVPLAPMGFVAGHLARRRAMRSAAAAASA
jgi:hypothetical protein